MMKTKEASATVNMSEVAEQAEAAKAGKPKKTVKEKIFLMIRIILMVMVALIAVMASIVFTGVRWMLATWQHLTMDELIFTVRHSLGGADSDFVRDVLHSVLPTTLLVLILLLVSYIVFFKKRKVLYPIMSVTVVASIVVALITANITIEELDVVEFIENQEVISDFIGDNYVNPHHMELIFPEQKRNLIYIYLESMETTFVDVESGGAFAYNVIPQLTTLAKENEDFSGAESAINGAVTLPGTTWTTGGMFAQTAGLPLLIPIDGSAMDTQDEFFPELLTLGGILEEEGYANYLLIGSDAAFGGRELYFTTHGNFTIFDYYYAHDNGLIPEDHRVWWGFEDWRLFDIAREKLLEIAENEEPFNFTMLTVDTHFPDGWLCEECPDFFDDQYKNVFLCADDQVASFIAWVQEQDFYENTTIVLSGDHLTMDGNFPKHKTIEYFRKTYTTVINSAVEVEDSTLRRHFSTMDLFPTTLAGLGVEIPGNRLGLGANLFSTEPTKLERYGIEKVTAELRKNSDFMDRLTENINADHPQIVRRRLENEMYHGSFTTIFPFDEENYLLSVLFDASSFEVIMCDFHVIAAVWSLPEQEDMQWIRGIQAENGLWIMNIDMMRTGLHTGDHHVHIFIRENEDNEVIAFHTTHAYIPEIEEEIFYDEWGNRVDAEGYRIDEEGYRMDEWGNRIYVDEWGNRIDEWGNFIDEWGNRIW
ncbi:MAG: LTA synthase family protein [Lachnospiraceae bacterium]|nr:LTA synthase family protein [Lachnospiraceae bacterium]